MLLDLSAAFGTVDQIKLQNILCSEIGIHGIAYKRFDSFLRLRTQKVMVKNAYSSEDMLQYGVKQGSVLGPVLFNIYFTHMSNLLASTLKVSLCYQTMSTTFMVNFH